MKLHFFHVENKAMQRYPMECNDLLSFYSVQLEIENVFSVVNYAVFKVNYAFIIRFWLKICDSKNYTFLQFYVHVSIFSSLNCAKISISIQLNTKQWNNR